MKIKIVKLFILVSMLMSSCSLTSYNTYKLTFKDGTTSTIQYFSCVPLEMGEVDCYSRELGGPVHAYYNVVEFEKIK